MTDPPADAMLAALGRTVRALRLARRWTRRALARQTGISERFLADIEGGRANPSLRRLAGLAAALGSTPAALLATPPAASPARRAVVLLGLRGAGKSAVGRRLAARLSCPFVELDALVERAAGLPLTELFLVHGEAYYRRAEAAQVEDLLAHPGPRVVAAGGGVVTSPPTFALLRERTHTVWLRARPEEHWTRVLAQGDTRPMADNDRAFADLCALLAEREEHYRQAELAVDTSGRTVDEVTDELARHFAFLTPAAGRGDSDGNRGGDSGDRDGDSDGGARPPSSSDAP